jgi:HK97 family phage major capsid protein/HK97 family phage prohead protease
MTEKTAFWHSFTEVKAVPSGDGRRIFSGMATTQMVDRVGDTVNPLGASFKNPLVLLHQHNHEKPIGTVTFDKPTSKGIKFTAEIPVVDEPGSFKDRVDTAWAEIKSGVVRAVSIGFRAMKYAFRDDGGIDFQEIEIYELSTVSVPANSAAMIDSVAKSVISLHENFDIAALAASGTTAATVETPPRVQGKKSVNLALKGSKPMAKSIAEQIASLQASRTEKDTARAAVIQKSIDENRSTDAAEQAEFDELSSEIDAIDGDLVRLKKMESSNAASAKPVVGAVGTVKTGDEGTAARGGSAIILKAPAPAPGIRLARYARCLALSRKTGQSLIELVEQNYGTRDPDLVGIVKANVIAVNTTTDAALIGNEGGFADFVEYLRPMTILGRFGNGGIPGLRRVPFRVPLITQTGGAVGYWVGEGKPKPLTKPSWSRREMAPLKAANIAVATMEALRDSSPSAEMLLRDDLANAIAAVMDLAFIDPANTGTSGVKPASITDGITPIPSSGNDAAAIRVDVQAAMAGFIAANNPLLSGVWIMSATTALALSMMRTALDQPEFPGLTMNGGTFMGLPVIVSQYVTDYVVLANAQDIYFGDDGGISVDMSTEASLQMMDNPTNDSITPTATDLVSMFQTNSVAFRAERTVNWLRRRDTAVQVIEDVAWGQPDVSP